MLNALVAGGLNGLFIALVVVAIVFPLQAYRGPRDYVAHRERRAGG